MPKIPVYFAEEKIPSQVADVTTAGLSYAAQIKAAEATARAAEQLSQQVTRVGGHVLELMRQQQDIDQAIAASQLSFDLHARLGELRTKYENDPDWSTKIERYTQEARQLIDEYTREIRDRQVQKRVITHGYQTITSGVQHLANVVQQQKKDAYLADAMRSLQEYQRLEATATSADEIAQLRARRQELLTGLAQSGVITQAQAVKLMQEIDERTEHTRMMELIYANPKAAIEILQNKQLQLLPPEQRITLLRQAQREDEHLRNRAIAELNFKFHLEDRLRREQERQVKEMQDRENAILTQKRLQGKLTHEELDRAYKERRISPDDYERHLRAMAADVQNELQFYSRVLTKQFSLHGPMAALDQDNAKYVASLIEELHIRVRQGEVPQKAAYDIILREQQNPNPAGLPLPYFLKGQKTDLQALEQAAKDTEAAFNEKKISVDFYMQQILLLQQLIQIAKKKMADQKKTEEILNEPEVPESIF